MGPNPTVSKLVPLPALAVRTHCPFCAYQCGIRMADDHAISGDPHFPVNNGQLCIKGWSAAALLDHPDRLTAPLVRDRRSEPFRRTTWDDALDRIANAWDRTRNEFGPDANGVFGSGALTNEKVYLLGKFARVALRTANIDYNGRYCMSSAAAGNNRAFGVDRGMPFPVSDIAQAEVVVLVGSNCADTLPPIMQWFLAQKANGGRLVVIDPRKTPTAKSADLHLPVTPGTDLELANGLLHLALDMGLVNHRYIADRTTGFDTVRAMVLNDHPARVERLTGVSEGLLRQLVRWMAAAGSCMILSGRGAEQHSKGADTVNAWTNLALALGLPGKPFSGFGTLTGQGNGQGGREQGQKADQLPGYRLIENPAHRDALARVWGVSAESLPRKGKSAYELIDALGTGTGAIRTMFVMGSNLVVASPDQNRTVERLKATHFLAVADAFVNETSQLADVVLPIYQWAEEDGTMTNFEGRVIRRRRTAVAPKGVRGDIDVLRELAHRLGCGAKFDFHDAEAVFDELRRATAGGVADYSGITYQAIEDNEGVFWPCPETASPPVTDGGKGSVGTPRLFVDRFYHPDGKARFIPVEHRRAGDTPDEQFPYLFTTGRYKEHYNSGAQTRLVEELIKAKPRPVLELHPTLAARHSITASSVVTLESRRGRAEFTVRITVDIRPDTLFAPFHWGGREGANTLIGGFLDPTSRMPEYKLAAVRIVRVQPSGV
jgi:assimilatory nitrate reductase catalytic subunit